MGGFNRESGTIPQEKRDVNQRSRTIEPEVDEDHKEDGQSVGERPKPMNTNAEKALRAQLQILEQSKIATSIKELMFQWNVNHLVDAKDKKSYVKSVRERSDHVTIAQLLEEMVELFGRQNPNFQLEYKENPAKAVKRMFDVLFQWLLSLNRDEDKRKQREEIWLMQDQVNKIIR